MLAVFSYQLHAGIKADGYNEQALYFLGVPDTIRDTLTYLLKDSLRIAALKEKSSPNAIEDKVHYVCRDSIRFDLKNQKVFLYGNAEINYQDINLKADYVEIDFTTNILYATGLPDSTGKLAGLPIFTEGSQSFKSKVMRYNFKSKKGFINQVITEDSYGFLHGNNVKKLADNEINISGGSYTTCDLEDHPHFTFKYNKSKVIPGKRIVTGPAYLEIEDVPLPLGIPFGWFPTKSGQRSGIILPTYGEMANRGFYFEGGGYYFAISDHLDLEILGDIYTRGSWAIRPTLRYNKRYKYSGSFNFGYAINIEGVKETPSYSKKRDFTVRWSHRQDPKARPRSNFSADVNIVSSTFNKYNPSSAQDYLSNTFRSSIAYQTNWAGKYFLTLNASHSQNTLTHQVTVTLPEVSFSVNRFNPFMAKNKVGRVRWYENITVSYNLNARNNVTAADSVFFQESTLQALQNGIKHSLPISSPVKLLKYITMTNSLNLNDRMYFQYIQKYWSNDTLFTSNDTIVGYPVTDTIPSFSNIFDFSISSSLSTKIYGIFRFGKKFPIQAIRHVMTPSVSFSYTPDFGSNFWGYYDSYTNADGNEIKYSKFEGAIFGSPPSAESGRVGLNLVNNLEMKVRSRKDTISGMKKIVLIDNFTIGISYDLARDSLNWSPLVLSGRTRLVKNLDISYRSEWDPYILDSNGTRNLNRTEWAVNRRLFRLDQTNWTVSLNYRLSSKDFGKGKKTAQESQATLGTEQEKEDIFLNPDQYIDWSIPWDIAMSYSFNYTAVHHYPEYIQEIDKKIVQTLAVNGNVSITPKWKIGVTTGWDFVNNDLSYTSLNIYRDLHCWEMRFNWIPTGFRKSWNFSINAKASILQDLKLTKKKDFRDF